MNKNILIVISILLTFIFSLANCAKDKANPACEYKDCSYGEVTYQNDIKPMVRKYCMTNLGPGTGCHDAWIDNYTNLKNRVDWGDIQREVIDTREMPIIPNNFDIHAHSEDEIRMWRCWICDGAPNN